MNLIICTYNRYSYLIRTLDYLNRSDIRNYISRIVFVDDNSSDKRIVSEANSFLSKIGIEGKVFISPVRHGIKNSLKIGVANCDHSKDIINLDSDALVRNDYFFEIWKLRNNYPNNIISGFHCESKWVDNIEIHPVDSVGEDVVFKRSVGGINLLFDIHEYNQYILPSLEKEGGWDTACFIKYYADGNTVVVPKISLVQHIGMDSSMGHKGGDIAETFKSLHLPNVTLAIVDSDSDRMNLAFDNATKDIIFGDVLLLGDGIKSKEEYSRFIIKELPSSIKTDYVLICQYDGYPIDATKWDNEFFNYDYIGASWSYAYNNVGNGGFSFRSKKLMVACAETIEDSHPEDDRICRSYRAQLEKSGLVFAPKEIADKFSVEKDRYNGQFGFHGEYAKPQVIRKEWQDCSTIILNQPAFLGDIIFIRNIARDLKSQGKEVILPVMEKFLPYQPYIDAKMIDFRLLNYDPNNREFIIDKDTAVLPLRFSDHVIKVPYNQVMRAKYDMLEMDWEKWNEIELPSPLNPLPIPLSSYTLVNTFFSDGKQVEIDAKGRVVQMKTIGNYTLMDWIPIIQNADEIHTVSSSIIYLLELLPIKAKEVHIYLRRPQESNHSNYDYILRRHNYILHE